MTKVKIINYVPDTSLNAQIRYSVSQYLDLKYIIHTHTHCTNP
jgi:hypothetical protein